MRWRCAASAKFLFKELQEKFHRHLGTVCTKVPDIFQTGSQWRAQIKSAIQAQPWVARRGAPTIPRATAEPACSISAAAELLPARGSGQRYQLRAENPSHLPRLAACACTEHCHPQPAAAALPGCWTELGTRWAEKGQSALFGINTALGCPWLEKLGCLGSWFSCSNWS